MRPATPPTAVKKRGILKDGGGWMKREMEITREIWEKEKERLEKELKEANSRGEDYHTQAVFRKIKLKEQNVVMETLKAQLGQQTEATVQREREKHEKERNMQYQINLLKKDLELAQLKLTHAKTMFGEKEKAMDKTTEELKETRARLDIVQSENLEMSKEMVTLKLRPIHSDVSTMTEPAQPGEPARPHQPTQHAPPVSPNPSMPSERVENTSIVSSPSLPSHPSSSHSPFHTQQNPYAYRMEGEPTDTNFQPTVSVGHSTSSTVYPSDRNQNGSVAEQGEGNDIDDLNPSFLTYLDVYRTQDSAHLTASSTPVQAHWDPNEIFSDDDDTVDQSTVSMDQSRNTVADRLDVSRTTVVDRMNKSLPTAVDRLNKSRIAVTDRLNKSHQHTTTVHRNRSRVNKNSSTGKQRPTPSHPLIVGVLKEEDIDPNTRRSILCPKKPARCNVFVVFMERKKEELRKQYPQWATGKIHKVACRKYRELRKEQKMIYRTLAEEEIHRREQEKEARNAALDLDMVTIDDESDD